MDHSKRMERHCRRSQHAIYEMRGTKANVGPMNGQRTRQLVILVQGPPLGLLPAVASLRSGLSELLFVVNLDLGLCKMARESWFQR